MSDDADAIVIGSGPSGLSVIPPLLESGLRLIVLDGGRVRDDRLVPQLAYHDQRRGDPEQWRQFLGPDLESLRPSGPPSPKFRSPSARFAFEGFDSGLGIEGRRFAVAGSLARGGFSTIWGAGLGLYDAEDLEEFPVSVVDLAPSYRELAGRMGVSGFGDDDLATELDAGIPVQEPMRLAENARRLLSRYRRRRDAVHGDGVRIGRPRIAVLTESVGDRRACALCDACLWGCRHGSIWSASHDLNRIVSHPRLDHRPGTIVERIETSDSGYRVIAGGSSWTARRLILAAGTLATTRLLLGLLGRYEEDVPLLCSPTAAFALCMPGRIGAAISTRDYSMAQLSYTVRTATDRCYGNLFPASGIPGAFLVEGMPLTRPGAIALSRLLQPAMLVGNCFLPGGRDRHRVRLERRSDDSSRLVVEGEPDPNLGRRLREVRRRLRRAFGRLGAFLLPSSFRAAEAGSDLRYAGTFPMRREPGPGEVDLAGELHGHAGLHIVDLSIFPAMGAKHPTFTLMANADRIGRRIATGQTGRSGS